MRKERNYHRNPFSLFFIMMLVVIIGVSAGFSFFYYNVYNRASQNEVITERASEIKASERYLENLIDALTRQMNAMIYAKEIYMWNDSTAGYEAYHAVMEILNENKIKHSAIHSIYLVYEGQDVVLTSNEGYFSVEKFYDDTWKEYEKGSLWLTEENEKIGISATHKLTPRSIQDADVISLVAKVRAGMSWQDTGESAGYLVVNISMKKLVEVLDAENWQNDTGEQELAIINEENALIYDGTQGKFALFKEEDLTKLKRGSEDYIIKEVQGVPYLCQKVYFKDAGWYLLRISEITNKADSMLWARNLMCVALLVSLLAIVVMFTVIWKRVYQPYNRLLAKIKKGDIASSESGSMEYLEEIIARTLDTKELLLESYFERMLLGGGSQAEEPEAKIIHIGKFRLFLAEQNHRMRELGPTSASLQLTALRNCIRQFMMEEQRELRLKECYCISMTDMRVAVLAELAEDETGEGLVSCLQILLQYVTVQRNANISFGVSLEHASEKEMHQAYLEAKDALGIRYFFQERNIFYYEKTSQLKRDFYIENSVKVDIFTNNLYGMNIEEARGALGIIIADLHRELENVIYYNLPNFFSRIFERVYRAVRNIGLEPEQFFGLQVRESDNIFNIWEFDSMKEAVEMLYRMLDQIEDYQKAQQGISRKSGKQWAKIMLEYVDKNYDKGISLAAMAADLNLDESYLSRQFKEKIGVSFVQYVTKCRMDKAKELLADPNRKLADIAEIVGMGNVQSFIRTFKKYEGMTPGQYRESYMEKE